MTPGEYYMGQKYEDTDYHTIYSEFINNGTYGDYKNSNGITICHIIAWFGDLETLEHINDIEISNGRESIYKLVDNNGANLLHYFARSGNYLGFKKLLKSNPELNVPDTKGNTIWHYFALSGSYKFLLMLLSEYNVQDNITGGILATLWHFLALSGNFISVVQAYKDKKFDDSTVNVLGDTVWHYLALSGNKLTMLNMKGVSGQNENLVANSVNKEGATPYHYFCMSGNYMGIKYLISCKDKFANSTNKKGHNAYQYILKSNNDKAIKWAIDNKHINKNDVPKELYNRLYPEGSTGIEKFAVDNNIDLDSFNENSYNIDPCFICLISRSLIVDPVLLSSGYSYNKFDIKKWLENNSTDPLTRENVNDTLLPNNTLKIQIMNFLSDIVKNRHSDPNLEKHFKKEKDIEASVQEPTENRRYYLEKLNYASNIGSASNVNNINNVNTAGTNNPLYNPFSADESRTEQLVEHNVNNINNSDNSVNNRSSDNYEQHIMLHILEAYNNIRTIRNFTARELCLCLHIEGRLYGIGIYSGRAQQYVERIFEHCRTCDEDSLIEHIKSFLDTNPDIIPEENSNKDLITIT